MKKLEIPYYSQYKDVTLESWSERACAPTCLKMVLDYLSEGEFNHSIDDIILEGTTIVGGYIEGVGWNHAGLIRIAHNHNFLAYDEEFRSIKVNTESKTFEKSEFENEMLEKGIEKMKKILGEGKPVIISCSKNFDEIHKPHQVVLTGFDDEGFYYHEPAKNSEEDGAHRQVSFDNFRIHWRKFAIFLSK